MQTRHQHSRPHLPTLRPLAAAAMLALLGDAASALPQGASPTFGHAQVDVTAPGAMTILQTSQRAGLDWRSFSIGRGETVLIRQPNRNSLLVNRVLGNDPSEIFGHLQSNGRVLLSNPRGVLFGRSGSVDVGGLVATTLAFNDADVERGRIALSANGTPGELRVEGSIRAAGGSVALAAPELTVTGSIDAQRVGLAAASHVQVDLDGDGLILFNARNDEGLATRLAMLGRLHAEGGSAELSAVARSGFAGTVLNLDGVVEARGLARRDGRIIVDGGTSGVTRVGGRLDAGGAQGGEVTVLGERIALDTTARIDASGASGGGQVQVGGGFQGRDPALHAATEVTMADGARITANATERGDGGRVVLWSDDLTRFDGRIEARGGLRGGDGGTVETSGRRSLASHLGQVDTGASHGRAGSWLLDPRDIRVNNDYGGEPEDEIIDPNVLNAAVGKVVLDATRDVFFDQAVTRTQAGALEVNAGRTINMRASVQVNGDLSLNAGQYIETDYGTSLNAGTANLIIRTPSADLGGNLNASTVSLSRVGSGSNSNLNLFAHVTATTVEFVGGPWAVGGQVDAPTISIGRADGRNVIPGSVTLLENNRLADQATVKVLRGGELIADVSCNDGVCVTPITEQVKAVVVDGGTLSGQGTLRANEFRLRQATVGIALADPEGGRGELIKEGDAATVATLSQANSYSGGTSITGGTLSIGVDSNLGAATTISIANGTLRATDTFTLDSQRAIRILGTGTIAVDSGQTLTYAGLIGNADGTASLIKSDAGTLRFEGFGLYTGGTTVRGGTLELAGTNGILRSPSIDVNADATLSTRARAGGRWLGNTELNVDGSWNLASDTTIGRLSGAGEVGIADAARLTTGGSGDSTFSGRIGGPGGVVKVGDGTFVLTGSNTYEGGTHIVGGTLQLGGDTATGRLAASPALGSGALVNDATLRVAGAAEFDQVVSGSGGLEKTGSGDLVFGANGGYRARGPIDIKLGRIVTRAANGLGVRATVHVDDDAALVLGGDQSFSVLDADGAVSVAQGLESIHLSGGEISAASAHNDWRNATVSIDATTLRLAAPDDATLHLGHVTLDQGSGEITAGRIELGGDVSLLGSSLVLGARAVPGATPDADGHVLPGSGSAYSRAADGIVQTGGSMRVDVGSSLSVVSAGSVRLARASNDFSGLSVYAGGALRNVGGTLVPVRAAHWLIGPQAEVEVAGSSVRVADDGIEGDRVSIAARTLRFGDGGARIVARLPYDLTLPVERQRPGLTLTWLGSATPSGPGAFGSPDAGIPVQVGTAGPGGRVNGGWVTMRDPNHRTGTQAVYLVGAPQGRDGAGYYLSYDLAGRPGTIPVAYNGEFLKRLPEAESEAVRPRPHDFDGDPGGPTDPGLNDPGPTTEGADSVKKASACDPAPRSLRCVIDTGKLQTSEVLRELVIQEVGKGRAPAGASAP